MSVDAELRSRPRWSPGFIGRGPEGLVDVYRELLRLADYLELPGLDGVQFVIQTEVAPRPREGLLMFFAAGVVGAGAGLYQYAGGIWKAL